MYFQGQQNQEPLTMGYIRGVQNNRLTEKTDKTEEKLTEKTEPKVKTD